MPSPMAPPRAARLLIAVLSAGAMRTGACEGGSRPVAPRLNGEPACAAGGALQRENSLIQTSRPGVMREAAMIDAGEGLGAGQAAAASAPPGAVPVVSYNLYWWNVKKHNRWGKLHSRIAAERPFALIGFQECKDVQSVLRHAGLPSFGSFQGPFPNPCPIAWDTKVFSALGHPGSKWVAKDEWGNRWMTWIRLRHVATGASVLFVNTHGPLHNCGAKLGERWASGVSAHKEEGDLVFMTGDFNCGTGSAAMNIIKGVLRGGIDGGIDQILTNGRTVSGGRLAGWPSDHPLVKGTFDLSGGPTISGPSPAPRPPGRCGDVEEGVDYYGDDLSKARGVGSAAECAELCGANPECKSFTWAKAGRDCYLKSTAQPGRRASGCCTSGLPACKTTTSTAAPATPTPGPGQCGEVEEDVDYYGGDLREAPSAKSAAACAAACGAEPACKSYTFVKASSNCYLKRDVKPGRHPSSCCTSGLPCKTGPSTTPAPPGYKLYKGYNCYAGRGADSVPGKYMTGRKSLDACKADCDREPRCEGIIRYSQFRTGKCFLRTDIRLERCQRSGPWDLWLKRT